MTNAQLKALRQSAGLSKAWCSECIGRFNQVQSWRYLEEGRNGVFKPVPEDIAARLRAVVDALK